MTEGFPHLKEALQYSDGDEKLNTREGSNWSEEREYRRHDDAHPKHPLPSNPLCQPPSRYLC